MCELAGVTWGLRSLVRARINKKFSYFVRKLRPVLIPIHEEVWTVGRDPKFVRRVGNRAAADRWDAARARAEELTANFIQRGYNDECGYAWGRGLGDKENHRFIVGEHMSQFIFRLTDGKESRYLRVQALNQSDAEFKAEKWCRGKGWRWPIFSYE
jgi:hypothetical protein